MTVCILTPLNLNKCSHLFPESLLDDLPASTLLLGCVEEEPLAAAGILMAHVEQREMVIDWLYVDEAFRRRGGGRAMLEGLRDAAKASGKLDGMTMTYTQVHQNMTEFLRACGFIAVYREGCRAFRSTLGDFHIFPVPAEKNGVLQSLRDVPPEEVARFSGVLGTGVIPNVGIRPPIDPMDYRPESCAYLERGKIRGLWLVQDERDGISFPWFCNISNSLSVPLSLMNTSLKQLKAALPASTTVSFASTNPDIEMIVRKHFRVSQNIDVYFATYLF